MRKAIVVGLTGPTGAGKGMVGQKLKKYGYEVIEADKIAALVMERGSPVLVKLAKTFGKDILNSDGTLNRAVLAERAFVSKEKVQLLNMITHPEIKRLILKKVNGAFWNGYEGVIIDAPQLFESGLDKECNFIISVTAPKELRLERIMERDEIDEKAALKRMNIQYDDAFFVQNSDIVIVNDGDEESLSEQVLKVARLMEQKISGEI